MSEPTSGPHPSPAAPPSEEAGSRQFGRFHGALLVAALVFIGTLLWISTPASIDSDGLELPSADARTTDMLLNTVVSSLDRLEDFNTEQMLVQTMERLNQWLRSREPSDDWKPDALIETLPTELRQLRPLADLKRWRFNVFDANHLLEVVTCRNVAAQARGDNLDDLARATRLFDWVVRNIQLDDDARHASALVQLPRSVLQTGHGSALDRAWCFMLVCRQQGLDVVILAVADNQAPGGWRDWVPALLHEGELRLFEPTLGVPIPGPQGQGIASLAQAATDDAVLRQMDLDAEHAYPIRASDLAQCRAYVEGNAGFLAERVEVMNAQLVGDDRLRLAVRPTEIAARLQGQPHIQAVQLWPYPFAKLAAAIRPESVQAAMESTMRYRPELLPGQPRDLQTPIVALQQARLLHLKGRYLGEARERSANLLYQMARPADEDVESVPLTEPQRDAIRATKQDASYWLGLVAYERGDYPLAISYLNTRTLGIWPKGPWSNGARYNLGRCYEALGDWDAAERWYALDTSPQRTGNLLRVRWGRASP